MRGEASWARAAMGHAAHALASPLKNRRRLIPDPRLLRATQYGSAWCSGRGLRPPMSHTLAKGRHDFAGEAAQLLLAAHERQDDVFDAGRLQLAERFADLLWRAVKRVGLGPLRGRRV